MTQAGRIAGALVATILVAFALSGAPHGQSGQAGVHNRDLPPFSGATNNPYRIVENWPDLGDIQPGAAIGIIPDGEGGTWLHHRSEPPIIKFDASGKIVKSFGDGMFVQAHGFCMDHDGNLWAGDSGSFRDDPATAGRGMQFFKFSPDGELLLTLGRAGVSKAGPDTFLGPTACAVAPNGDIVIADGHFPRAGQQDGDRIVRYSTDGTFIGEWGKQGSNPGEFKGPHALAFDSQGRLFVADRSNNRVQVFDKDMNVLDDWSISADRAAYGFLRMTRCSWLIQNRATAGSGRPNLGSPHHCRRVSGARAMLAGRTVSALAARRMVR